MRARFGTWITVAAAVECDGAVTPLSYDDALQAGNLDKTARTHTLSLWDGDKLTSLDCVVMTSQDGAYPG